MMNGRILHINVVVVVVLVVVVFRSSSRGDKSLNGFSVLRRYARVNRFHVSWRDRQTKPELAEPLQAEVGRNLSYPLSATPILNQ